jgi:hypothetical protein
MKIYNVCIEARVDHDKTILPIHWCFYDIHGERCNAFAYPALYRRPPSVVDFRDASINRKRAQLKNKDSFLLLADLFFGKSLINNLLLLISLK